MNTANPKASPISSLSFAIFTMSASLLTIAAFFGAPSSISDAKHWIENLRILQTDNWSSWQALSLLVYATISTSVSFVLIFVLMRTRLSLSKAKSKSYALSRATLNMHDFHDDLRDSREFARHTSHSDHLSVVEWCNTNRRICEDASESLASLASSLQGERCSAAIHILQDSDNLRAEFRDRVSLFERRNVRSGDLQFGTHMSEIMSEDSSKRPIRSTQCITQLSQWTDPSISSDEIPYKAALTVAIQLRLDRPLSNIRPLSKPGELRHIVGFITIETKKDFAHLDELTNLAAGCADSLYGLVVDFLDVEKTLIKKG